MDDQSEPERSLRTVELTPREMRLLVKYGYPWPEDEEKLRASRAVEGVHRVRINAYWIKMMIADLSRSARTIRSEALLEELDALCCALEHALADGA
ncbi:MAG: hypothetical protein ACREFT_02130 [Acetobacteraceae bacterium]